MALGSSSRGGAGAVLCDTAFVLASGGVSCAAARPHLTKKTPNAINANWPILLSRIIVPLDLNRKWRRRPSWNHPAIEHLVRDGWCDLVPYCVLTTLPSASCVTRNRHRTT